jgi:hypothetical protein
MAEVHALALLISSFPLPFLTFVLLQTPALRPSSDLPSLILATIPYPLPPLHSSNYSHLKQPIEYRHRHYIIIGRIHDGRSQGSVMYRNPGRDSMKIRMEFWNILPGN